MAVQRGCTDIICLIFFIAFLGGMGFIVYLSVTAGDPYAVFYGSDYLGNRCGIGKMADKPKVYYPRVDQDLIAQSVIASSMPWKLKFYGLCLEACPNVTTPEAWCVRTRTRSSQQRATPNPPSAHPCIS